MTFASRLAASALAAFTLATISLATITMTTLPAAAQQRGRDAPDTYRSDELVGAGHRFFGNVSRGLASVIEKAVSQWGLPNGYILGEEGSGAIVAGLRYGEGTLYTKNAGDLRVYWQGPSLGFDWGGDGARTMTLVYNLP
ncbi:MAG: EipA family protein, partial [Hyphomicrobiales bacterium]|nr:EipA family protein [Hyphomicrobiales bacterium]